MNDFAAVVAEDDESVEKPKGRSHNDEHVDGGNLAHVIVQKRAPSGGGGLGPPRHVSADGRLAHRHTEFEQFAVDAWCTPQRIGHAHSADQIADLSALPGPSQGA